MERGALALGVPTISPLSQRYLRSSYSTNSGQPQLATRPRGGLESSLTLSHLAMLLNHALKVRVRTQLVNWCHACLKLRGK